MNGLALCSGIGGLDLGLRLAIGEQYRTVCHVERDAFAAADLVARMEEAALDLAPIWDDVATFGGEPWRGIVDLVSAGFPCQPWSVAGKRKGTEDQRWLWPDIARIIGEVEPGLVYLENVPGLLRHGLREVLSDLASLGFDAEWTDLSAAAIGAPHRRERIFVLAWRVPLAERLDLRQLAERGPGAARSALAWDPEPRDVGPEGMGNSPGARAGDPSSSDGPRRTTRGAGRELGDAEGRARRVGERPSRRREDREEAHPGGPGLDVVDAERPERREDAGRRGRRSSRQHEAGEAPGGAAQRSRALEHTERPGLEGRGYPRPGWSAFPPGPGDTEGWVEWLAAGGAQPALRRGSHGVSIRVDQLRCLGNAVVPAQAAAAFLILAARYETKKPGAEAPGRVKRL